MRMFSLPAWISEPRGCDQVVHGVCPQLASAFNMHATDVPPTMNLKRKRPLDEPATDIVTVTIPEAKRLRPADGETTNGLPTVPMPASLDATPSKPIAKSKLSPSHIRMAVESQFGLEILMKHNELRLINQELSKCQIALEQLRRCHLIPFPTAQTDAEARLHITNGTGVAIARADNIQPQWAAPFGVTDGPYTRHYAKWLIPDPNFDGPLPELAHAGLGARASKTVPEGRTTRNSCADGMGYATTKSSRAQRGSTGSKLQALPSGYPQPKANNGPPVLKRSDGQWVKLVCLDCHRENFASIQGFINHCRIAHRRDFKSHEEAAQSCGHAVEVDEMGVIINNTPANASTTTTTTAISTSTSTTSSTSDDVKKEQPTAPSAPMATGLVHPMVRSAPTDREAYSALLSRIEDSLKLYHDGKLQGVSSIPRAVPSKDFVAASDTPHLSALLQRRGFSGNLDRLVGEAKTVDEVEDTSSTEEESDADRPPQRSSEAQSFDGHGDSAVAHVPAMRIPARSAMSPGPYRPTSSKGPEEGKVRRKPSMSTMSPRLPFASSLETSNVGHSRPHIVRDDAQYDELDSDLVMLDDASIDLSPHTIASNNAPSLVSDDGEYDDGSEDVESDLDESEHSDHGSDVAEIDIEDGDGVDKDVSGTLRHGNRDGGRMKLRKEDKHVTFVSPGRRDRKARGN